MGVEMEKKMKMSEKDFYHSPLLAKVPHYFYHRFMQIENNQTTTGNKMQTRGPLWTGVEKMKLIFHCLCLG
jgi:hypothetical protein